jgi:[ribosomal protein S18]-alanine N-acetyltransferase
MVRYSNINDNDILNEMLSNFNIKVNNEDIHTKYLLNIKSDIVGFLSYTHLYDKIEINYIYIKEEYRGKGYASELIDYLLKEDYSDITLEVRISNESAINLYLKKGFNIVATRKSYYQNEDGYLMHRKR